MDVDSDPSPLPLDTNVSVGPAELTEPQPEVCIMFEMVIYDIEPGPCVMQINPPVELDDDDLSLTLLQRFSVDVSVFEVRRHFLLASPPLFNLNHQFHPYSPRLLHPPVLQPPQALQYLA
jgi:hypothetical protein